MKNATLIYGQSVGNLGFCVPNAKEGRLLKMAVVVIMNGFIGMNANAAERDLMI